MANSVTLTNMSGYVWGVPTDETGININRLTIKASSDKILIKNRKGVPIARADFALKQEWDGEGYLTGTTGVPAYVVGALVVAANASGLGGFPTTAPLAALFVEEITATFQAGDAEKINYKLIAYFDIPATVTQAAG